MRSSLKLFQYASFAFCLMLAACGGGGGGGDGGSGSSGSSTAQNEGSPTSPINIGVVSNSVSRASSVGAWGTSYYHFQTGSTPGVYTISLTGTMSDLSWTLYSNTLAPLQICDNSISAVNEVCTTAALAANTDYYLTVDEWSTVAGTFTLSISAPAAPTTPAANAGPDQNVKTGVVVTLDGSASSDPNGDPITYAWTLTSVPAGSLAALNGAATVAPTFTADVEGVYTASLVVNDGSANSVADTVTVTANRDIRSLSFRVIDAEYSKSLNRIIMVSSQPSNQLHIYDPVAKTDTTVNLNLVPTSVSVSPDGLFAAVGHNAWVSYVNLSTAALVSTLPTTADVIDIVLAGNGYVYAFPRIDQWEPIRSINLTTGVETLSGGYSIYAGTRAKLHPGGIAIYGANNGLSPSDIEKYSITGGTAAYLYDSPYHGDYAMCGDLWMSEDGLRVFTKCGNVFRTSPNRYSSGTTAEDMTYNGALQNLTSVQHLTHSSAAGRVAAVPANTYSNSQADREVQLFNYDYLTFNSKVTLPYFVLSATSTFPAHGRFVFYNSAGTAYFVVVQADSSSGMLYDYGIVTY